MSESLKFLQERIAKNEKFCMICLRREHETRLVPPTSLNSFVTSMKKSSFALCYGEMACTLCENACRNALSLVKAFENTEKMYEILFQPDPPPVKKSRKKAVQDSTEKLANECIENLRQHREATTLKISETLVVSSDSPMECNFQSPPPPTLGIPNAIPTDPVITIIDDDDQTDADAGIVDSEQNLFRIDNSTQTNRAPAKRVLLKHQPITPNITKTYQRNKKTKAIGETSDGSYVITDINDGNGTAKDDNIRNLSLNVQAKPLHDSASTVPKLVSMEEFLQADTKNDMRRRNVACFWNDQKKLLVRLQDSCVVHDVVEYENRILVPFMSCEIKYGMLMYVPNLFPAPNLTAILAENLKGTKKVNGVNNVKISGFEVETSKFIETTNGTDLDKALEEVLKDMQTLNSLRSSNGGSADSTVSDPLFVIESVKSEAVVELSDDDEPQPVRVSCSGPVQKGRIDWEDKIPMDVISVVESDNTMLILPD